MFIISTASSLVVSIESNVVVVSISFRISFSLTDITPLTPDVTGVVVIRGVRVIVVVSLVPVVILGISFSFSFRFSFGLTDETPLSPEVTVVVISVVAISIITVIPSVITIAHGIIVSIPTVPSILSISFSLRLSKDRKDKEGCNKLKKMKEIFKKAVDILTTLIMPLTTKLFIHVFALR